SAGAHRERVSRRSRPISKAIDWPFRRSWRGLAVLTTRAGPSAREMLFAEATARRHGVGMKRAGSRRRPGCCGTAWRRPRLHPTFERFDDAHAPAAARTGRELIG